MKWGILATGNIAKKFANTINLMNSAGEPQSLQACASRTAEKAQEFALAYGIPASYGSYEAMMEDPEVEAVYIATPNNMHYENCRLCLENGKHVLCEKPFTLRVEEAEELYALAAQKQLMIMEGFWIRFLPALMKMQEIIASGEIGDVIYARSDYGFIAGGARKVRKFDPVLGGGALLDIGIYNLGFMRMVMQDASPIRWDYTYHLSEYGTDDFSSILLQYPGGRSATVTTSIGMDIPRAAAIYGSKGSIFLEDFQHADQLTIRRNGAEPQVLSYPIHMGGFEYEIRHFSECAASGRSQATVLKNEDTLDILHIMESLLTEWH